MLASDEQLLDYLHSFMLDPEQFVAGNLRIHTAAWQAFFSKCGKVRLPPCPMHSSSLPYLAIEFEGVVYAYQVYPFGSARACRDYTWTMGEVYMRLHGQVLTYVIDDALLAAHSRGRIVKTQVFY